MQEGKCITLLLLVIGIIEFIMSLITIKSTESTGFWFFRIIDSLSITVLFWSFYDATNHRYQDGAAPLLIILPCSVIVIIICELISLINYICFGLSSQFEKYIYISQFIISIISILLICIIIILYK